MPLTNTSTLAGFPDGNSTGVRDGVALTVVGDMTVTTPGAVISGLEIHGTLRIEADNVTVRDCKIVNEGGYNGILIPDGNSGAVVEYCDIVGPINGISGAGTFRSNDISGTDNGINVYGPSLIVDNYIHDMSGGSDAHYDGIEINGGGGTTIRHNTIINDHSQTSAVMIDNYFGGVTGIIVDNNYLAGGGYTIYSDARFSSTEPITGVQITNNYLGQGYWGYYAFFQNTPLVSGNTQLGTTWPTPVSSTSGGTPPPGPGPTILSFSSDSGTAGDHITNDTTLTLKGSAAANSTVRIYDKGTQIGSTTADSSGAWTYTTGALSNATHSFTATATSGGTTSASSSALLVTVDTIAPAAPIIVSNTINSSKVTLNGTAEANSTVRVYEGGTLLGQTTANGSGTWNYTTGTLSSGTHNLTAAAMDAAGNTGGSTALALTVNAAPTNAAPTIVSFSRDSNIVGDGITNDNTLRLVGTAAANSTVRIYDKGTQIGSTTADSSGAWTYTTGALSNATHSLTATATSGGTTSASSSALLVTVDTIAPAAPIIVSNTISSSKLTLNGTAEANSTVRVYEGGTLLGQTTANGSGAWNYTTGTLSSGPHNLTAAAMDAAGNTGGSTGLAVTVNTVGTPTTFAGTSGNDVLEGTIGADTLMGGAGNDTYTVNHIGDKVVEFANQGTDKVESTISYTLADNVENLQLMGGAQISGTGNGLNNTIIGNDVSNTLTGGAGNDTLNGWGGKDTLFGNSGNDVFQFSSQFSADGDTVADFMPGQDKLDFSKIDANAWNAGDQAFVFDGYTNGGSNGHLWASEDQLAGVTHVYGKTGDFQFHIDLQGTRLGLTASNFTL